MAEATTGSNTSKRRSRGVKAGLDLPAILRAAQAIDRGVLTMQAVADELGVDRKAVNHHVSDRDTLLQLVAADAFSNRFVDVRIPDDADWRTACRIFALGIADSVLAAGPLADHLRLDASVIDAVLAANETVMRTLVEAGFDDDTAIRVMALLSDIAMTHARDAIETARTGRRARRTWLRAALDARNGAPLPYVERMASAAVDTYARNQLEYAVDVVLHGTEAMRERRRTPPG